MRAHRQVPHDARALMLMTRARQSCWPMLPADARARQSCWPMLPTDAREGQSCWPMPPDGARAPKLLASSYSDQNDVINLTVDVVLPIECPSNCQYCELDSSNNDAQCKYGGCMTGYVMRDDRQCERKHTMIALKITLR